MKILITAPVLFPCGGDTRYQGIERLVAYWAGELQRLGHKVSVASAAGSFFPRGIEHIEVPRGDFTQGELVAYGIYGHRLGEFDLVLEFSHSHWAMRERKLPAVCWVWHNPKMMQPPLPDYNVACCSPDTGVIAAEGIKDIKELRIGEMVLTHLGFFQKVTQTFKRHYKGEIISIRISKFKEPLHLTPEHPVLAIQTSKCNYSNGKTSVCKPNCGMLKSGSALVMHENAKTYRRNCGKPYELYKPAWIQAGQLTKRHALIYPISLPPANDIKPIDLSIYNPAVNEDNGYLFYRERTNRGKRNRIPRFLFPSPGLMEFLGFYVAEGCISKNRFHTSYFAFSFGQEETYINRVRELGQELFGLIAVVRRWTTASQVVFQSKILRNFLAASFGAGARNKRIPNWLLNLDNKLLAAFVSAAIKGDGHIRQEYISYCTASRTLAYQMRDIFLRLGIVPTLYHRRNKDSYVLSIAGNPEHKILASIIGVEEPPKSEKGHRFWTNDGYVALPVEKIEELQYNGPVYNLEVEGDGSYCTASAVIHNCLSEWQQAHLWAYQRVRAKVVDPHCGVGREPEPQAQGFCFIGRLTPTKNPLGAIELCREVGESLAIIGDSGPGDPPEYVQKVKEQCQDSITLWQGVADSVRDSILASSQALLHPLLLGYEESHSHKSVDAMTCGCPVISYATGAMPEVIEHGVTGFLARDRAEFLGYMLEAGKLDRNEVRKRAIERWGIPQTVARALPLLERVARGQWM